MKLRVCYICAERSSEVEGRIPLCDWCADKWAKSGRHSDTLRTDLRIDDVDSDDNHANSYAFTFTPN